MQPIETESSDFNKITHEIKLFHKYIELHNKMIEDCIMSCESTTQEIMRFVDMHFDPSGKEQMLNHLKQITTPFKEQLLKGMLPEHYQRRVYESCVNLSEKKSMNSDEFVIFDSFSKLLSSLMLIIGEKTVQNNAMVILMKRYTDETENEN